MKIRDFNFRDFLIGITKDINGNIIPNVCYNVNTKTNIISENCFGNFSNDDIFSLIRLVSINKGSLNIVLNPDNTLSMSTDIDFLVLFDTFIKKLQKDNGSLKVFN